MKKRYQRNHFKAFSNSVNKKKLYKKGKNWVVGSLTLLALAGLGVTANHTVHADGDANTKAATTSVGSTANIEHKAKAMYNGMIANQIANPSAGQPTQKGTPSSASAKSNVASSSASQSSQSSSKASSVSAKTTAPSTANKTTSSAKTTTPVKPGLGGANLLAENQPTSISSQGSANPSASNSNSSVTPSASSSNGVNMKAAKSASQSTSADQLPIAKAAALHNAVDKHNLNAVKPKMLLGGSRPSLDYYAHIVNNDLNNASDQYEHVEKTEDLINEYQKMQSDAQVFNNFKNFYSMNRSEIFLYTSAISHYNSFVNDYSSFENNIDPLMSDAKTLNGIHNFVINDYVPVVHNDENNILNLPSNLKDIYQTFGNNVYQFNNEFNSFSHFHSELLNPEFSMFKQSSIRNAAIHYNSALGIFSSQINPEYAQYILGYRSCVLSNDSTNVTNKSNEINNLQKSASDTDLNTLSTSLTNDVNTFRAHFGNNNEGFISESEAFPRATNFQASRNLFGAAGNDYTQASAANSQVNSDFNKYQNKYSSYVGSLSKDATNFANESASISGDNQSASNASLSTFSTSFNADSTAFNNQYNAHDYKNATHTVSQANTDYNNYTSAYTSYVGSLSNDATDIANKSASASSDKKVFTNSKLDDLYSSFSNDASTFNTKYNSHDYKDADGVASQANTDYKNYVSAYKSYKELQKLHISINSLSDANNAIYNSELNIDQYTGNISYSNTLSLSGDLVKASNAVNTNYDSAKANYMNLANSLSDNTLASTSNEVSNAVSASGAFESASSAYNKDLLSSLSNVVKSLGTLNTSASQDEINVNSVNDKYGQSDNMATLSGSISTESNIISSDYTQLSNDYSSLNAQLNSSHGLGSTLLGGSEPISTTETFGNDNNRIHNHENITNPLGQNYTDYMNDGKNREKQTGNYRGFNYVYNPISDSTEFTSGSADSNNLSDFLMHAPTEIQHSKSLTFDSAANVSNVTNMKNMFAGSDAGNEYGLGNTSIQAITLHGFNTHKVTDMSDMFAELPQLHTLNLSNNFDTTHAKTTYMFGRGGNNENPNVNIHANIPNLAEFNVPSDGYQANVEIKKTIKFKYLDYGNAPVLDQLQSTTYWASVNANSMPLYYVSAYDKGTLPNSDNWVLLGNSSNGNPTNKYNYTIPADSNNLTLYFKPIYKGMFYKYNPDSNSIEFTNANDYSDKPVDISDEYGRISDTNLTSLNNFITNAPKYVKDAKSIKFDSDINFNSVTNMNNMFAGAPNLQSVVFAYNSNKNGNDFSDLNQVNGMFQNDKMLNHVSLPLDKVYGGNKVSDFRDMFNGDNNYPAQNLYNDTKNWVINSNQEFTTEPRNIQYSDMFKDTHLANNSTLGVDQNGTPKTYSYNKYGETKLFAQPTQYIKYVDYLTNDPIATLGTQKVVGSNNNFIPGHGYKTVTSNYSLGNVNSDNDNKTNQYNNGNDTFTVPVVPSYIKATGMWGSYRYELSDYGTLTIQGMKNTPDTDYSLPSDHHLSNDEQMEVPILQTVGDKLDPSSDSDNSNSNYIKNIVFQGDAVNAPSDSRQLLSGMPYLQTITNKNGGYLDFTRHHTSDISYLFGGIRTNYDDPAAMMTGCADKSLHEVDGMSKWGKNPHQDLSDVTNMAYAFANTGFSDLDLRNWNPGTHKAFTSGPIMKLNTYLKSDGHGGYNLASHDSDWANNTDYGINDMFSSMPNITSIQLGDFDTSQCHRFDSLFVSDPELNYLNLGRDFHTQNAGKMYNMFTNDKSLSSDSFSDSSFKPSDFVTNKVTDMSHMFENTRFKTLDLSKWRTPSCYDMSDMFSENPQLANLDISNFDTRNKAGSTDYITGAGHDNVEPNDMNLSWMFRLDYNLQNLKLGSNTFLTPNTELTGPWMTNLAPSGRDRSDINYNYYGLDDASYSDLGNANAKAHKGQWTRNADVVNYVLQGHKVTDTGAYKGHHKFFVGKTWSSSSDHHLQNWNDVAAGRTWELQSFAPSSETPNGIPTQYEVVPGDDYGDSEYPFKYHTGIDTDYLMDNDPNSAQIHIHFVDYDNNDKVISDKNGKPLNSDTVFGNGYSMFNINNYRVNIPSNWSLHNPNTGLSGNVSNKTAGVNEFDPNDPNQHVDIQLSKNVSDKIQYYDYSDPNQTWPGPTFTSGESGTKDSELSDFVYSHVSSKDFTSTDGVPKGYYVVDSDYGEAKEQLLDPHKSGNDAQLLHKDYTWKIPVAKKAYNVTVKYFDTTTSQAVQIPGTTISETLDPENNDFHIMSDLYNHRLDNYGYVLDGGESDNTLHGYPASDYRHSDGNASQYNNTNRGYIKTPVMNHLTSDKVFDIYVKRLGQIQVNYLGPNNKTISKSELSPIYSTGTLFDIHGNNSNNMPYLKDISGYHIDHISDNNDHNIGDNSIVGDDVGFVDHGQEKDIEPQQINVHYAPNVANMHIYYENADNGSQISSEVSLQANANTSFSIGNYSGKNYAPSSISGFHLIASMHPTTSYDANNNETHTIDVLYAPNTSTKDYAPAVDTVKYLDQAGNAISAANSNMTEYSRSDNVTSASSATYGSWVTRSAFSSINYPSIISANGSYYSEIASGTNLTVPTNSEVNTSLNNSNVNHEASFENDIRYSLMPSGTVTIHYVDGQGSELAALNSSVATNVSGESFTMPEYPANVSNYYEIAANTSLADQQNGTLPSKFNGSNQNIYVHYLPDTANIHVYYEDADTGREISGYPESLASSATNASFNVAPYVKPINGYHFVNSMHPATSYDANNGETHTIDLLYAPNSGSSTNTSSATDTINYLISGTNSAVAPSSTDSVEFSRAVNSASGQAPSYGKWMTNSAFVPVTYNSVIISNGVRYREVSADTSVPTPNLASDDFNANRVASFSNDIYYAPDSVTTSTQSATVNATYDYVLYSQGGSSIASAANETVTYTRPYRFDATLNSSSVGSWVANASFTQPTSYASAGWHVVASNVAVPDVTNLQPGETSNDSYQVDYLSTSDYHTSYASSTATENINYIENNNGHDNTVSSFSKTVNLSQPTIYENDNNQQLFKGAWTFASQGDQFTTSVASLSGWTANSSNGVIPLSATGVAPGTYNENIYYVPAKANVHVYFEAESDGHQLASQSDFTSSVNAPFSLADYENRFNNAGYHYVTALHPADSYDPSTGEVHTIDLLYAKNNQTTSNVAPESAAVTETTYDEWNRGASNVSEAASATTYHYTRNGSLVYNPATKNYSDHYSDWKLLNNSSTSNRSINLNGYYYETTVGNLPSAATLQNLAPNANVSYSDYQLYAPNSASYTNSAVSGAATETVYYHVNNSIVSSATYTSGVNLNRNALVSANNHNYVVDPGEWRVASGRGFALPASASFAGYYATSSNGNVPRNTLNVDPGNYSENVYYSPAKANIHVYYEDADNGNNMLPNNSFSDFTSSVNAPFHMSTLGDYQTKFNSQNYHFVGEMHPANGNQFDPNNGETHTIDLLYAPNKPQVPGAKSSIHVHYIDSDDHPVTVNGRVSDNFNNRQAGTAFTMPHISDVAGYQSGNENVINPVTKFSSDNGHVTNVYVQYHKVVPGVQPITVNYISSDNTKLGSAKYTNANTTMSDIQKAINGKTFNNYTHINTLNMPSGFTTHPQTVYVIYRPDHPVTHRGHIHVRYVDDSNNGRELWSDKFSDNVGAPFDLDIDNYRIRYVPDRTFDGRVAYNTNKFGNQSANDPYIIVVGYAKPKPKSSASATPSSTASSASSKASSASSKASSSVAPSASSSVSSSASQPSSSASSISSAPVIPSSQASSQSSAAPQHRSARATNNQPKLKTKQTKPVYIPKNGKGRAIRRQMIREIEKLENLIDQDIRAIQSRVVAVHKYDEHAHKQQMVHEIHIKREDLAKKEVHLRKLKAHKLPQTGESQSYSAMYAMLFVLSSVILAGLGKAIEKRRHE